MSYQVLARKYRPRNFDTLVGQEHVVRALTHALEQQRLHHAYLFTGTRGVGKTTLSRILAKALNCIGPDGNGDITATPCGVCEACVAIDAGRFVDYIEMDAASNRGVDEMAQLLEQAVYAPSNARFKVYMIDEVHMLTNHAFNSMLKTLEEPPAHVKFILATTDPQKIPVTVLSRCLQFNLKQMPPGHIVGHLEDILGQETIEFEVPALRLLAQGAHGSMRDALSLTDQAIAYAAGKVTLEAVQGMLGALDQSYLIRVLDALAAQDGASLLAVADDMAARSLSYNAALQDLGTLLHQIALAQTVPAALPEDLPHREDIVRLAAVLTAEDVQLFYQIVVHGRNELGLAPDEYAGFSMTLLRMLAFRPVDGGAAGSAPGSGSASTPAPAVNRPAAARPAAQLLATPPVAVSVPVARTAPSSAAAAATAAATASGSVPATVSAIDSALAAPAAMTAAPAAAPSASPGPMQSARAAALEAARAGSGGRGARPAASAAPATVRAAPAVPAPAAVSAQATAAPVPVPAPVSAPIPVPAASPAARPMAAQQDSTQFSSEPPPWDEDPSLTAAPPGQKKTEFDAPRAVTQPAQQAYATSPPGARTASPAPAQAAAAPAAPIEMHEPDADTVRGLRDAAAAFGWDGDWPRLATELPLRGVAQQLALHSELTRIETVGGSFILHLRIPFANLSAAGSVEKLSACLSERFGNKVSVETITGGVAHTADAQAQVVRRQRQQKAEASLRVDPFVQAMMRDFGATIVPDSIRPL